MRAEFIQSICTDIRPRSGIVDHRSLTSDAIAVSIKVPSITRLASPDRCSPCPTGRIAVRIIDGSTGRPRWLICTRSTMAVPSTILAVVMAAVCCKASPVSAGGCGVQKQEQGKQERQDSDGTQQPKLDPKAALIFAFSVLPLCHFSTTLRVGRSIGAPAPLRSAPLRQTAHGP